MRNEDPSLFFIYEGEAELEIETNNNNNNTTSGGSSSVKIINSSVKIIHLKKNDVIG